MRKDKINFDFLQYSVLFTVGGLFIYHELPVGNYCLGLFHNLGSLVLIGIFFTFLTYLTYSVPNLENKIYGNPVFLAEIDDGRTFKDNLKSFPIKIFLLKSIM